MAHQPFTALEQDQLDWISRFSDRLRVDDPRFAEEHRRDEASEIARSAWERGQWREASPEEAARRWLAQRDPH
jgi:hypothetical protein